MVRDETLCASLAARGWYGCSPDPLRDHDLRIGRAGVDISLFLSQLGYCITYLIFVAQNLGPMLRSVLPPESSWLAESTTLILLQVKIRAAMCVGEQACSDEQSLSGRLGGWG